MSFGEPIQPGGDANALIDRFVRGEIASVYVVYMKFFSAGLASIALP